MVKISELIKKRKSIRTYQSEILSKDKIIQIQQLLQKINRTGPFNNKIKFELILLNPEEIKKLHKLINYGFIKGSPAFIAGIMELRNRSLEDFGYLMETLILRTVEFNLDTCWLGGSLDKHSFLNKLNLHDKESLPAIFSVGIGSQKKRIFDSLIRSTLKGDHRKSWDNLFFKGDIRLPLKIKECGKYQLPLEMVRLAPSASNRQPWRIILDESIKCFNFYLARNKIYSRTLKLRGKSDLQKLDMGIAMAHFELTAQEVNLKGKWKILDSVPASGATNLEYIVSWEANNV